MFGAHGDSWLRCALETVGHWLQKSLSENSQISLLLALPITNHLTLARGPANMYLVPIRKGSPPSFGLMCQGHAIWGFQTRAASSRRAVKHLRESPARLGCGGPSFHRLPEPTFRPPLSRRLHAQNHSVTSPSASSNPGRAPGPLTVCRAGSSPPRTATDKVRDLTRGDFNRHQPHPGT